MRPAARQKFAQSCGHLATIETRGHLPTSLCSGPTEPLLPAMRFSGAPLGKIGAFLLLLKKSAQLRFKRLENCHILVKFGYQRIDDLLGFADHFTLRCTLPGIAFTSLSYCIEQAPRRMRAIHEHLSIQQGHLDVGHHKTAD
ncbi:MAG: hypothetical protein DDT26_02476 [Dehalococcoidia bacterium]|nr:hypothetical protein [Chloroflexota bacterium]